MAVDDYRDAARNGAAPALLALAGVTKSWGEHLVLDGVDLEIRAGAVVSVSGANGAGKTTLLRIATGMILPDEGALRFRGRNVEENRPAFQRAIGLLSAGDRGLYARLTVRQNLDFAGGLANLSRNRRRERIEGVLSEFEITALGDRRVDRLSMGQRQRVRLALTFLHQPTIVFLDEPRTSLDEAGVSLLDAALAGLVAAGGAALVATPETYAPLASHSWTLSKGRLYASVPEKVEVGLGHAAGEAVAPVAIRS